MADEQTGPKSISDVARETQIPETTLRYYDKEFEEYLDIKRDSANRRLFDERAVKQLLYIRRLLQKDGMSLKQVKDRLAVERELTASGARPVDDAAISAIHDRLARIERQQELLVKAVESTLTEVRNSKRLLDLNLTRLSLLFGSADKK